MSRTFLYGSAAAAGYFLLLIGLATATEIWNIPLSQGSGFIVLPSYWGLFLAAYYFLVPIALALAFAFWRGRNWRAGLLLAAAIFAIHGAASALAAGLRGAYLAAWQQEAELVQSADVSPGPFTHTFLDRNDDGLTDQVVISGDLPTDGLPPGRYQLLGQLAQAGIDAAKPSLGAQDIEVSAANKIAQEVRFEIDPQRLKDQAAIGPFSVELQISQWREVSAYGKGVLTLCAWVLWCATGRGGQDPAIYPDLQLIAQITDLDSFTLYPNQIQRPQFIVKGYSTDYGRDLDGNGLLDELVIALEVDSLWAGELFFQAELDALSDTALNYETRIEKGAGIVELVIDGSAIKSAGQDGPYRLESPIIFNNTPYCPGGVCANKNQPMFSVTAPDYTTGPYRAADFE